VIEIIPPSLYYSQQGAAAALYKVYQKLILQLMTNLVVSIIYAPCPSAAALIFCFVRLKILAVMPGELGF
jgi:hypothetical protein